MKRTLHLSMVVLGLLALLSFVPGDATASRGGPAPMGAWVPSGDDSGCSISGDTCLEWGLRLADGSEIPTGSFCCHPADEPIPRTYQACRAPRV